MGSTDGTAAPRITGMLTTLNEERHVEACLRSLAWCDRVLLVDSFSTDRTMEIAGGLDLGVPFEIVQREYNGAAAQKNWALARMETEWLFILDADERCTPELAAEIRALIATNPAEDAIVQRRTNFYLGQRLRFSGVRNDRVARLIRPGKVRYQDRRVHARIVLEDGRIADHTMPFTREPILHYHVESIPQHLERMRRYGYWGAAQAWVDGKRTGPFMVLARTLWRFLRGYFVQLGILDGWAGLFFCTSQAFAAYAKWSTLWGWERAEGRGISPDLPSFEHAR